MTSARVLTASSRLLVPEERFDVLVHALAQLPDTVTLQLWAGGPARTEVETLARVHGIDDRLSISVDPPAGDLRQVVYPSPLNAATAPLRPEEHPTSLVFDPDGAHRGPGRQVSTFAELLDELSPREDPPASCHASEADLRGIRVAVVTNLPAPYRIPLFATLERRLRRAGGSLRVFFLAPGSRARPWMVAEASAFDHEVLPSARIPVGKRHRLVPVVLERRLARFRPSLLLVGGFSPLVAGRVGRYARRRGVPFGLWSGEIRSLPTARAKVRTHARRRLARNAGFAISYGFESGEYLRGLRADLPVVYGRNTSSGGATTRAPHRTGPVEILTVADLGSARKGVDVLVDALAVAPSLRCRLTVVGGGRELPRLAARARHDERIHFLGPLPRAEVGNFYAAADVFAFPTRADVFGLVLVEAMAAGLPTVVSSAPGALADVAVPGRNCLVVSDYDPRAWAAALAALVEDPRLRDELGAHAARTIARRWTLEHAADAMIAGLRLGLPGLPVPPQSRPLAAERVGRQPAPVT
jgi:glycosyltransferase involved in cell wall biosynthesis